MTALCAALAALAVGDPAYSVFYRNQENAAVRIPVTALRSWWRKTAALGSCWQPPRG